MMSIKEEKVEVKKEVAATLEVEEKKKEDIYEDDLSIPAFLRRTRR